MRKILLLVLLIASVCMAKQRSTRNGLRSTVVEHEAVAADTAAVDTLCGDAAARLITVSGYEKPLRSRHETMLLTNNDSTASVTGVSLDITYCDMQGRTLHRRTADAPVSIPPGCTRMVDLKSWDVNMLFYYHLNEPSRISTQATPYRVKITPMSVNLSIWR